MSANEHPPPARAPKPVAAVAAPPHDLQAEEALIGSLMLSRAALTEARAAGLQDVDFYQPANRLLYAAIETVIDAGGLADPVALAGTLDAELEQVGGRRRLFEIQARTPSSANAPVYARIIRELSQRRTLLALSYDLAIHAREGTDPADALAHIATVTAPADTRARLAAGGAFVLDAPPNISAVWGTDDRVLWARGEELLIVGPPGVGKTTIAMQLLAGRLGLGHHTLLDLPIEPARRVLYLACDRPDQIRRALHRLLKGADRDELDQRLIIWKGPPPHDFAKHPETLAALAHDTGADCVFIDSLKDVAIGLSDDEVGAALNSSIQRALADGIDVCALHHQRKGQGGAKPRSLEDVYGSVWITAGAGSVLLLWGSAGDPIVELIHLKQPAAEIGPITIDHDHNTGLTSVYRGAVDPLVVLRRSPHGITARDLAQLNTGKTDPNDNERRKAKRSLDRLVSQNLATILEGGVGKREDGKSGASSDRYFAKTDREEEPF